MGRSDPDKRRRQREDEEEKRKKAAQKQAAPGDSVELHVPGPPAADAPAPPTPPTPPVHAKAPGGDPHHGDGPPAHIDLSG